MNEYKRPVCRGGFSLNTACGRCERCDEERAKIREEDIKTQLKKVHPCFEAWWESEGAAMLSKVTPDIDNQVKNIIETAWSNGAYKAEEELGVFNK